MIKSKNFINFKYSKIQEFKKLMTRKFIKINKINKDTVKCKKSNNSKKCS